MSESVVIRAEFPPALMTRDVAAYYIGKSTRELDMLRETNELTAYGDGKRVYFKKVELDEWIASRPERVPSKAVAS